MGVVYKITNTLNGKGYVGITSQPLNWRINAHRSVSRTKSYAIAKAIRRYGFENFTVETLFEHDDYDVLKLKEVQLIIEHNTFGADGQGYNLTRGGDGTVGARLTPEQSAALSASRKGRKASPETKAKLSAMRRGRSCSPETRAKIAASLKGRPCPPKTRAAIAATKAKKRNSL